jgi:hypothetical protein
MTLDMVLRAVLRGLLQRAPSDRDVRYLVEKLAEQGYSIQKIDRG